MFTLAPSRRALTLAALLSISLGASALDKPKGKPVLELSGQISQTNAPQQAQFDMAMLAALPQHSFSTQTPWYPKPVKFTGPLLRDVLRAAGARGNTIVAVALNDYKTEIPFQDAMQYQVIVARLMNDKPMPVREKGPLFIIYPFDSQSELRAALYYNRSAWQLRSLQIK